MNDSDFASVGTGKIETRAETNSLFGFDVDFSRTKKLPNTGVTCDIYSYTYGAKHFLIKRIREEHRNKPVVWAAFEKECYYSTWILLIDVVFVGVCVALMLDMLFHTDYTIRGDKLEIRCGILFRMTLPVSRIIEINHKSTMLSSPALSAKRIGIRYGRKNWVYVSPQNLEDFISDLRSINPEIAIS